MKAKRKISPKSAAMKKLPSAILNQEVGIFQNFITSV